MSRPSAIPTSEALFDPVKGSAVGLVAVVSTARVVVVSPNGRIIVVVVLPSVPIVVVVATVVVVVVARAGSWRSVVAGSAVAFTTRVSGSGLPARSGPPDRRDRVDEVGRQVEGERDRRARLSARPGAGVHPERTNTQRRTAGVEWQQSVSRLRAPPVERCQEQASVAGVRDADVGAQVKLGSLL